MLMLAAVVWAQNPIDSTSYQGGISVNGKSVTAVFDAEDALRNPNLSVDQGFRENIVSSTNIKNVYFVIGTENGWDKKNWLKMAQVKGKYVWSFEIKLHPGIWPFKFVVETKTTREGQNIKEWWTKNPWDPQVADRSGNSLLVITED